MFDQTDFIRLRDEWREIKFRRDFEAKWAEPVVPRYDVVRRVALWLMRKRLEDEFELKPVSGRTLQDVEADLARLPTIRARTTELPPGSERETGDNLRLFVELKPNAMSRDQVEQMLAPDPGFHHVTAQNLRDFRGKMSEHWRDFHIGLSSAYHPAQAGSLSSMESAIEGRNAPAHDSTYTQVDCTLTQGSCAAVIELLKGLERQLSGHPQAAVFMSIDVNRAFHIASRKLEKGEGERFETVRSGPYQPLLYHLHAFGPPAWPEEPLDQWPPRDYALDYPVASWVIEEHL
jgi:hypothetical protein